LEESVSEFVKDGMIHYVYFLFDERAVNHFYPYGGRKLVYVGKGQGRRVRESVDEYDAEVGEIRSWFASETVAFTVERCLIRLVGKENLRNKADGGSRPSTGWKRTSEDVEGIRKRMLGNRITLGMKRSIEERRKISQRMMGNQRARGHKQTEEHKRKRLAKSRLWWSKLTVEEQEAFRQRHREIQRILAEQKE